MVSGANGVQQCAVISAAAGRAHVLRVHGPLERTTLPALREQVERLMASGRRFLLCDLHRRKRQRWRRAWCRSIVGDESVRQRLPAPRKELTRVDAALTRNLRHRMAGTACFRDELKLFFLAPPPPPLRPRDDLDPTAHLPSD